MRLIEAYAENFGVLHQAHLRFAQGITAWVQLNGAGKTTWALFLRAMLYGLPGGRRTTGDDLRTRVTPWQGGAFGGWLELETGTGRIRVERRFGARPREDVCCIRDAAGRVCPEPPEGLGKQLFGLDADGFARCLDWTPTGGKGDYPHSVAEQLRAALTGSPESFADAVKRLEAARRALQPLRGTGGETARCEQEWAARRTEWAASVEAARRADDLDRQQKACAQALLQAHAAQDAARTQAMQRAALQAQVDDARRALPAQLPDDDALNRAEKAAQILARAGRATAINPCVRPEKAELDAAEQALLRRNEADRILEAQRITPELQQQGKELEAFFRSGLPDESDVAQWVKQADALATLRSTSAQHGGTGCIIGGVVLAAAGVLLLLLCVHRNAAWRAAGAAALAVGIGLCAFGCILRRTQRGQKQRADALAAELDAVRQRFAPEQDIAAAVQEVAAHRAKWAELHTQWTQMRTARANALHTRSDADLELDAFFARFGRPGETDAAALTQLRASTEQPEEGSEKSAAQEWQDFCKTYALPLNTEPLTTLATLRAAMQRLRDAQRAWAEAPSGETSPETLGAQVEQLEAQNAQLHRAWIEAQDEAAWIDERRMRMQQAQQALENARHQVILLDQTRTLLQQAQDRLAERWAEPLQTRFSHYFSLACGAPAPEARFDPELRLFFTQQGSARASSCFSSGVQALADLCVRLALIDLLFTKERPFLLLDDPFAHLDPENRARAVRLLHTVSGTTQIVYFTCCPERSAGLNAADSTPQDRMV